MTRAVVLFLALSACFSDRVRPAPPELRIALDQLSVRSPGELTGSLEASDVDGMDSVWLSVDSVRVNGWNAGFVTDFNTSFLVSIAQGYTIGTRLPIRLSARDVTGFTATLDTAVVVAAS